MTNCSDVLESMDPNHRIFMLVCLSTVLIVGILFNSLAMWVFCLKMRKWTETRVFMMSLMASDCCLLFTMPFRIYAVYKTWDLGVITCKIALSCYFMNTYMSISIITLIAVDRYVAIKFPIRARALRSPKKAVVACGTVWILLLATRIFLDLTTTVNANSHICFWKNTRRPLLRSLYFAVLGIFIPLVIVVFCDTRDASEKKSVRRAFNIIMSNFVVFVICFLPIHVGYTVRFVAESFNASCYMREQVNIYMHVANLVANSNCVLDSVGYFFAVHEFWDGLKAGTGHSDRPESGQSLAAKGGRAQHVLLTQQYLRVDALSASSAAKGLRVARCRVWVSDGDISIHPTNPPLQGQVMGTS
uniref:G-protein coupled receptors family 1 profile domain-containing protein n=1 Tax=Leptobrachium leishanense TaxID=445787 RepID=A0A8C5R2J0_9ANUR